LSKLDATTVLQLARLQQQEWVDEAIAQRIAAGAVAAVEAVTASLHEAAPGLLTRDHADFLPALEALAGEAE